MILEDPRELLDILREARALLGRPGNAFTRSGWVDDGHAFWELDELMEVVGAGRLPSRSSLAVLFAPTGPIQEVSLSSGWADEYQALAARFDAVAERLYSGRARRRKRP